MNKSEIFDKSLQHLARFSKVLSNPARLAILLYLSKNKVSISGKISSNLPLGRTTISRHLKELKDFGLIESQIDGNKINYWLSPKEITENFRSLKKFLNSLNTQTQRNEILF